MKTGFGTEKKKPDRTGTIYKYINEIGHSQYIRWQKIIFMMNKTKEIILSG